MRGSRINWTDCTFNPWEGCAKVSPGCTNCYAEARDRRNLYGEGSHWGVNASRRIMSDAYWRQPLAWNREAQKAGTRLRVFCASLADWADDNSPAGQRERLWTLIRQTPHLDWLLLSKRPANIRKYLPAEWGTGCVNVWLGVTVENRKHGLPRVDVLRGIPAVCRFLSCEPLLEDLGEVDLSGIHWAIVGGETGVGARSMDTSWVKSIIQQCRAQNVAPWVKQLGRLPSGSQQGLVILDANGKRSRSGENWDQWPETLADLKVRELPTIGYAEELVA